MRWGTPEEINGVKKVLKKFRENNPDVALNINIIPWRAYWQRLQTSIAGGTGPDVFLLSPKFFADFISRDILTKLDDFIKEDKKEIDLQDFFKSPFEAFKYNNSLYALPSDFAVMMLFYNKDIFDKAGLKYPTNNWTWENLINIGKKLTGDFNGDGIRDRFGFIVPRWFEGLWGNLMYQKGLRLFNKSRTKCLINTPEMYKIFKLMYDMEKKYKIAPASSERSSLGGGTEALFLTGRVAMVSENSFRIKLFESANFRWDVVLLPTFKGKKHICIANGNAYAINKSSKHKKLAWELIKYMVSREAQEIVGNTHILIPIRKSIVFSDKYLKGLNITKDNIIKAIKNSYSKKDISGIPRLTEMFKYIDDELSLAFLDKKPLQKALDDAAKKVNKILAEINKNK